MSLLRFNAIAIPIIYDSTFYDKRKIIAVYLILMQCITFANYEFHFLLKDEQIV